MHPSSRFAPTGPWVPRATMLPAGYTHMRLPFMPATVPANGLLQRVPLGLPLPTTPVTSRTVTPVAATLRPGIVPLPSPLGIARAGLPGQTAIQASAVGEASLAHVTGPCIRIAQPTGPPIIHPHPLALRHAVSAAFPTAAGFLAAQPGVGIPPTSVALAAAAAVNGGAMLPRPAFTFPMYRPLNPLGGLIPTPRIHTQPGLMTPMAAAPVLPQGVIPQAQTQPPAAGAPQSPSDAPLPKLTAAPGGSTPATTEGASLDDQASTDSVATTNDTLATVTMASTPLVFHKPATNGENIPLNGVRYPVGHPAASLAQLGPNSHSTLGSSKGLSSPPATMNSNLGKRSLSDHEEKHYDLDTGEPLMKRPKPLPSTAVGVP